VNVTGALLAAAGLALFLFFAVVPFHRVVLRAEPVQHATGEFGLTLAPTGQTAEVPTRVTCLPIQGYLAPGQEQSSACRPRDDSRSRVAVVGLAALVAGGVVWQLSRAGRSTLEDQAAG
jgi:hypothetical protein